MCQYNLVQLSKPIDHRQERAAHSVERTCLLSSNFLYVFVLFSFPETTLGSALKFGSDGINSWSRLIFEY